MPRSDDQYDCYTVKNGGLTGINMRFRELAEYFNFISSCAL